MRYCAIEKNICPVQGYNAEYYQQYSQYWSQYAAWQQWQSQYSAWEQHQQSNGGPQPPQPPAPAEKTKADDPYSLLAGPLNQLVEHTRKKTEVLEDPSGWLEESEVHLPPVCGQSIEEYFSRGGGNMESSTEQHVRVPVA